MQAKLFLVKLLSIALLSGAGGVAVMLVVKTLGPIPFAVSSTVTQKMNLFTSQGQAEIEAIPDEARLTVGINVNKNTVLAAQEEANGVIAAITEEIMKLGIKKDALKTSQYSINPNYDYSSGANKIVGYSVNSSLTVTLTDFSKVNEVIDLATAKGANQVGGISFVLSEAKEKELKAQAREEAIADAKNSASELARLSGVKLGKVVDVIESNNDYWPMPMSARPEMSMVKDAGGGVPTSIEPGSTTYSYSVTLSYETL